MLSAELCSSGTSLGTVRDVICPLEYTLADRTIVRVEDVRARRGHDTRCPRFRTTNPKISTAAWEIVTASTHGCQLPHAWEETENVTTVTFSERLLRDLL